MNKLLWGILTLFLLIFLSACPLDNPIIGGNGPGGSSGPGGRVVQPVIVISPSSAYPFYNGPVEISFTSTTPDAEFHYTLNRTAPNLTSPKWTTGSAPIEIAPGHANISDSPHYRNIQVRVIAVKEGMTNSFARARNFQIFETKQPSVWENKTTEVFYGLGPGHYLQTAQGTGQIRVGIRLVDGVIDAAGATFEPNHGGTSDTDEQFPAAVAHARAFWALMNHWDFDVADGFDTMSGATDTGRGIREAARQALIAADVINDD